MELVNRYLHAVRFWLPKAQQDDIIAELGEDLRSQIEARESRLGHPLDDDAVAAILKERGHPMLLASRYLPPRTLIGPALTPVYFFILRLVILWILIPVFILIVGPATVLASKNPSAALLELPWTLAMAAVFAFGAITLTFAAMERYPHESLWKWNPRRLPKVPVVKPVPGPQPVPGYTAIIEFLTAIGFSLLWCDLIWFRTTFDFNGVQITLAPLWRDFFWPMLLLFLCGVPLGVMGWRRPDWMRARSIARLAVDSCTLVLLGALSKMGPWVTIAAANLPVKGVADANSWANAGTAIGLAVISLVTLIDAIQEAVRLSRMKHASGRMPAAIHR